MWATATTTSFAPAVYITSPLSLFPSFLSFFSHDIIGVIFIHINFHYIFLIDKCRGKGPKLYVWPWALSEDVDWSKDE